MSQPSPSDFAALYSRFHSPIATLNCGEKCAPYNERGVPFCCDTHHIVPSAYQPEWEYLWTNTGLWHLWQPEDSHKLSHLNSALPEGQVLVECLGHNQCQRNFRSIACRSFPFFPYLTRQGEFIGITYYWEYEDRCWVISNLSCVTQEYLAEFIRAYDTLFKWNPAEIENFHHQSTRMRRRFGQLHRAIPLLHRNGDFYKITPSNGRMRRAQLEHLPKFGPYRIAAKLTFPDE
jgi:hypothetical protein